MTDDGFACFTDYNLLAPAVVDYHMTARLGAAVVPEAMRRRPGWTQGLPIRGTDGQLWYFPTLDMATIATAPGLPEEVHEVGLTHLVWSRLADDAPAKLAAKTTYDIRVGRLACWLLGLNYAWDDRTPDLFPLDELDPAVFFARSLDLDPTGWDIPGRFPMALLAHRDETMAVVVAGQMERAARYVADLTETEAFRAFDRGLPSLN